MSVSCKLKTQFYFSALLSWPDAATLIQYQTGYNNKGPRIVLFTHLSLSVIKSEQWKV